MLLQRCKARPMPANPHTVEFSPLPGATLQVLVVHLSIHRRVEDIIICTSSHLFTPQRRRYLRACPACDSSRVNILTPIRPEASGIGYELRGSPCRSIIQFCTRMQSDAAPTWPLYALLRKSGCSGIGRVVSDEEPRCHVPAIGSCSIRPCGVRRGRPVTR